MPQIAARPSPQYAAVPASPLDTALQGGADSPVLTLPSLVLPANDQGRDNTWVPLPEPQKAGLQRLVSDRVGWMSSERHAPFMSLLMLLLQDMKDQRNVRSAMLQGKRDATKAALNAHRSKLEAEKSGLAFTMVTAITGAVVGGATGGDVGKVLSDTTKKIGEYVNKAYGPQAKADQLELVAKRWEMLETLFEPVEEDAKAALDAAREEFDLALRIIRESEERATQVTQRMTSW